MKRVLSSRLMHRAARVFASPVEGLFFYLGNVRKHFLCCPFCDAEIKLRYVDNSCPNCGVFVHIHNCQGRYATESVYDSLARIGTTNLLSPYATDLSIGGFAATEDEMTGFKQIVDDIVSTSQVYPKTVLDVGSGCGVISHLFALRNCEVFAVEPHAKFVSGNNYYVSDQIHVFNMKMEEFLESGCDQSFDIIMFHSSLGYFRSAGKLLRTLTGMLSPGGCINVSGCVRSKQSYSGIAKLNAFINGRYFYPWKSYPQLFAIKDFPALAGNIVSHHEINGGDVFVIRPPVEDRL